MSTRAAAKNKSRKPLETTLGKAPVCTDNDPIDLSHVRKPIETSIFGLRQVLSLLETATDEVRGYVAYECNVIYECRMCRTIYRSLANFILHKRNYCRESYRHSGGTSCCNNCQGNESYVTQADPDCVLANAKDPSEDNSDAASPIPPKCDSKPPKVALLSSTSAESREAKKNLTQVLRQLKGRQESSLIVQQCLSEDASNESKTSEKEETKNSVALQNIATTKSGVFQTMFRNMAEEYKGDLMKTEVMEIHDVLENNEAILGSDGKIIPSEFEKNCSFTCTICNHKFATRKTLTYHIKYKHNDNTAVYQCPECNDTYANSWSVFRHLYKKHHKSNAQVKRLRNQIHTNIVRKDKQPERKNVNYEKSISGLSSSSQERVNLENQQWMEDFEGHNDLQRCGGCGRKFDRKAALHSHSQFCSMRIAVCNTIKENSTKRVSVEDKHSDKTLKVGKLLVTGSAESTIRGAKRRKLLVSQRMCRVDYVKDDNNEKEEVGKIGENINGGEEKAESEVEGTRDDQDKKIEEEKEKKYNTRSSNNVDKEIIDDIVSTIIQLNAEKPDTPSKEVLVVQDLEDDGADYHKIEKDDRPTTRQKTKVCNRSRSTSSDISFVDATKLQQTIEDVIDSNLNDDSSSTKTAIVTRSKSRLGLYNTNSTEETEATSSVLDIVDAKNVEQTTEIISSGQKQPTECIKSETIKDCKRKRTKLDAGYSKKTKKEAIKPKNQLNKTFLVTLEGKSLKYIDKDKNTCLTCKKSFKSRKALMKHMSFHFSWYRYQCRKCSYMSYSRSRCDRHADIKHGVHDEALLKNTVLHIPHWKTVSVSTEFNERPQKLKLCKSKKVSAKKVEETTQPDHPNDEIKSENIQKDTSESVPEEDKEPESEKPPTDEEPFPIADVQDPSLRKMIMEVIFGSNNDTPTQLLDHDCPVLEPQTEQDRKEGFRGFQNSPDIIQSSKLQGAMLRDTPRPVRNRIATAQKDFLYDLTQILKPKVTKDKEVSPPLGTSKDAEVMKKRKPLKVYSKDPKSKIKKVPPITLLNGKKSVVDRSEPPVLEPSVTVVEDINMNNKNLLKKHVTGDRDQ